ncbi:TIGR02679 family protein [Desulfotomaculum arcticum]|uniref:TIGR02679 family protein n=1 Tax=Desulfotruncus arcticus DSM 17038 TaxID=1121424 RepID=A0A1I2PIB8_9FIRM|nr:TIGR02679 family protein [Desulfotomaculum arcticum] [Desulfotruncus arcticus DSM 17038]
MGGISVNSHLKTHRELEEYFDHSSFQKLFGAISQKYKSLSRIGGTIKLIGLSPEECDVLSGFLGRDCRDRNEITVKLLEVDNILRQSRFDITLPDFLSLYFGNRILSNKEAVLLESRKWSVFFTGLQEQTRTPVTRAWLTELSAGRGTGYRTVLAIYRHNEREAAELLKTCVNAMDLLAQHPDRRQRLPVFAARLTGDPHALDGDRPLGRLLFFGLHHLYRLSETEYGAERRKILFSRAGLEEDDVSSNVIVAGLRVRPGDPREPVFTAATAAASPLLLPLRFVEQPTAWLPAAVYTLENPAVFSAILDFAEEESIEMPSLVCTSGQPSVAALKLLDQLVQAGCTIRYGGDFDPKGLEIGQRLAERYGASFQPWFFNHTTYLNAPRGVRLAQEQIKKLTGQQASWDNKLIETMLQTGKAVYQEVLVEQMIQELILDKKP